MSADIPQLVGYLVRALVDEPDKVTIVEKREGENLLFEVSVDPEDVGKLIGRQGRIIKSIRTLARAAGATSHADVNVEILG